MTRQAARQLPVGLYLLYWKDGGSSVASVGITETGERWMAPANWVSPDTDGRYWRRVKKAELLLAPSGAAG